MRSRAGRWLALAAGLLGIAAAVWLLEATRPGLAPAAPGERRDATALFYTELEVLPGARDPLARGSQ